MARAIARLYNDGGVGLLEAGTGVGKSLGYLVPALRWAAANGERTVVSTNTINLQEQLVGKDLPFLARRAHRSAGALRAAQGMAQLPLPAAPRAGARVGQRAVRRRRCSDELDALAAWAERTTRRLAERPHDAAAPRGVGRGRGRARSLPARAVPDFEQVLPVQGAARGGAGGRDRRQSPPAAVRPRRAPRDAELGRGGGAAGVHAAGRSTRGITSRTRRRRTSGATVSRRSLQRLFDRLDRRGKGLLAGADRAARRAPTIC